jgi:hypothetical protein
MKQFLNRYTFFNYFIATHLLFIVMQIYNYTCIISYSYTKQKSEKMLCKMIAQKQMIQQQLCSAQDLQSINQWAQKENALKKIPLSHIKKLALNDTSTSV